MKKSSLNQKIAVWVNKQSWIPKTEFMKKMEDSTISIMLDQALKARKERISEQIKETNKNISIKLILSSISFLLGLTIIWVSPVLSLIPLILTLYLLVSLILDVSNIYLLKDGASTSRPLLINTTI